MRHTLLFLALATLPGCGLLGGDDDTNIDDGTDVEGTDGDGTDVDDPDTNGDDIVPTNCRSTDFELEAIPNAYPDSMGFAVDTVGGGAGLILIVNDTTSGVFDLEYNVTNPLFCDRCVLMLVDEGTYAGFQGEIEVVGTPTESTVSVRLTNAAFRELDDSFQPVSDGDCVEFDAPMEVSTEDIILLPSDCPQISVDTGSLHLDSLFGGYFVANIHDPMGEISGELRMEFFSNDTGLHDLSTGDNSNYSTCDQCVSIVGDTAPRAFQSRGSMRVRGEPMGNTLDIDLTNVELTEVTLGDNQVTTPVPNARCWSLPNPLELYVD